MTRLGDVTALDRLGIPVWQAVRPMSRALSVHQGKGLDHASARIGALMEAVESHHAECWDRIDLRAAWDRLPPTRRSVAATDFALRRDTPISGALDWVVAEPIGDGRPFFVPFDAVSLDLSVPGAAGVRRSSDGQAAHFEVWAATANALRELVERDARSAREDEALPLRMRRLIDLDSINHDWFQELRARFEVRQVSIRLSLLPAIVAMPVILCELVDRRPTSSAHRATGGAAAHHCPEAALRAALVEAAQSRATIISGARDDLPLAAGARAGAARPQATLGLPPGVRGLSFPHPDRAVCDQHAAATIVDDLARAGYRQAGAVRLTPADSPAVVVKAFVPGLGAGRRARRLET
jgi:ribosomal protein S12 methylthiotransferase accessory factor